MQLTWGARRGMRWQRPQAGQGRLSCLHLGGLGSRQLGGHSGLAGAGLLRLAGPGVRTTGGAPVERQALDARVPGVGLVVDAWWYGRQYDRQAVQASGVSGVDLVAIGGQGRCRGALRTAPLPFLPLPPSLLSRDWLSYLPPTNPPTHPGR